MHTDTHAPRFLDTPQKQALVEVAYDVGRFLAGLSTFIIPMAMAFS